MQAHKYPFFLTTEATLNVANDEKVLANMRLSGFKRIFVGVETPSLESLKQTNKCHNTKKDMTQCVHDIVSQGMEVSGGFIVGFDSDQPDIFDRQITFIREAAIPWAMVGTLAAIPNTALWKRLEQEGRLLGYVDGDQFGRPNFRPRMDPEVLYQGYLKILAAIYDPEAYYSRVLATLDRVHRANLPNLHESNYPLSKVAYLLVRALFLLGVVAPYRRSFWRFLRAVVRRFPRLFVPALANAIIGHHFIRYTQEVLTRQRALLPHSLDGEPAAVSDVPVSK
ncbi:MAG: DUF4070 domain-containing protein [Candidatus Riflebacteria bacterium]|nr:DUF4070 domain-containing protein [Candidatus Riflebacteria bacterium]